MQIHFYIFIFLFLFGLTVMIRHKNLLKKVIGMYVMQTSIILFFVTLGAKRGSTVPILFKHYPDFPAEAFANPLPHVLMLTAIVVGVATLGLALGLLILIYRRYNTLIAEDIHD